MSTFESNAHWTATVLSYLRDLSEGPAAWWEDDGIAGDLRKKLTAVPPALLGEGLNRAIDAPDIDSADVAIAARLVEPSPEIGDVLARIVTTGSPSARLAAFEAIASGVFTNLVPVLCDALERDDSDLARSGAAAALSSFPSQEVSCMQVLLRLANDVDSGYITRAFCLSSLGILGVPDALRIATKVARDPQSPDLWRAHGLATMYLLGDFEALLELVSAVDGAGLFETVLERIDPYHNPAAPDEALALRKVLNGNNVTAHLSGRNVQRLQEMAG